MGEVCVRVCPAGAGPGRVTAAVQGVRLHACRDLPTHTILQARGCGREAAHGRAASMGHGHPWQWPLPMGWRHRHPWRSHSANCAQHWLSSACAWLRAQALLQIAVKAGPWPCSIGEARARPDAAWARLPPGALGQPPGRPPQVLLGWSRTVQAGRQSEQAADGAGQTGSWQQQARVARFRAQQASADTFDIPGCAGCVVFGVQRLVPNYEHSCERPALQTCRTRRRTVPYWACETDGHACVQTRSGASPAAVQLP